MNDNKLKAIRQACMDYHARYRILVKEGDEEFTVQDLMDLIEEYKCMKAKLRRMSDQYFMVN